MQVISFVSLSAERVAVVRNSFLRGSTLIWADGAVFSVLQREIRAMFRQAVAALMSNFNRTEPYGRIRY